MGQKPQNYLAERKPKTVEKMVTRTLVLKLPHPPSMNGYWRAFKGRVILSKRGREYRQFVLDKFGVFFRPVFERNILLKVNIFWLPPDRRKRDIDNYLKPLLDVLEHMNVYDDDSQITSLHVEKGEIIKPGHMIVGICVNNKKTLSLSECVEKVEEQICLEWMTWSAE